jgi:hypothetical protein
LISLNIKISVNLTPNLGVHLGYACPEAESGGAPSRLLRNWRRIIQEFSTRPVRNEGIENARDE